MTPLIIQRDNCKKRSEIRPQASLAQTDDHNFRVNLIIAERYYAYFTFLFSLSHVE